MYALAIPHISTRLPPTVSELLLKSQVEDSFFIESHLKQELSKCFLKQLSEEPSWIRANWFLNFSYLHFIVNI